MVTKLAMNLQGPLPRQQLPLRLHFQLWRRSGDPKPTRRRLPVSNLEGVPGGGDVPRGGHAQLPPWLKHSRYGHIICNFSFFIRRCVIPVKKICTCWVFLLLSSFYQPLAAWSTSGSSLILVSWDVCVLEKTSHLQGSL